MRQVLKVVGGSVLLAIVVLALAVTIVPRFLDRIYYRGPASAHFDGERFANPDNDADTQQIQPAGGGRAGFFWRYFTGSDGRPAWPKLVQTQGLNILTDPVWAETAGPLGAGPRRVAEPGIAFDALPKIDLVLVSHNHYDHLDKATLGRLWQRDRPRIVTSLGNDSVIGQTGAKATALDWGQRVTIKPGVAVTVTRNHHWGSRWFTDRNRALWSSFVVNLPGGNVFFAGDTGMGDDAQSGVSQNRNLGRRTTIA